PRSENDPGRLVATPELLTVEHKDHKKSNEMYYPRFTKVVINHFMSKDPSIPRRNKVNRHYVRDDHMFSTIKLVSRHQNTQQFGALLLMELTNEEIRNSNAYKEYYAVATGAAPPKPKASVRKTRSSSDTTITPPTTAADKGTGSIPRVLDVTSDESEKELSWNSTDEEGDDDEGKDGDGDDDDDNQEVEKDDEEEEGGDDEQEYDEEEYDEETKDEESFDPMSKTPKNSDDEGNGEEDLGLNGGREEGHDEEEKEDELYRDVNINQGRGTKSIFETTSQMDAQTPTLVALLPMTAPTMTPSTIATITTTSEAPILPTTALSTIIQDLPNFGSLFGFDNRLRTLEAHFSKFMQTNQFAGAVSAILGIVQRYMDQRMNEAVKVAVQLESDRLCDEAQRENDKFLKTVDENMQKIIKEHIKEQVKVQVSKILPRIEQTMNEQLEAKFVTRSSHSSKTSYAVAVDLSEMELKKILIEKIKGNKETVTLKRRRDDDVDKDEEPSAGPDRGSKRHREGKEPESASAPKGKATRSVGKSTQGSKSRQASESESALADEPMQTTFQMEDPSHLEFDTGAEDQPIVQSSQHLEWFSQQQKPPTPDRDWNKTLLAIQGSIQPWISELANQTDSRSSFNELMDTPLDFSNFLINWLKRRVEDLQLGVEIYQKKLNLTKPDSYRSDLKCKEAYTTYSNPRGFIHQNKDKKNRLIRIDELHKFSDGTLTNVRTDLDDHLKGIQMQYLPQSIWRKSDKERAAAMIQAINKRLKTRRIMRSLERDYSVQQSPCLTWQKILSQFQQVVSKLDTTSGGTGKKSGRTVTLTAEDMQKRKNDVKARTTLLLSLPNEHQLRFSKYKTAQELWAVILKTFGGNEAIKKTKKNLLK
nr:hypothetical protein [Tanacetum cinerariifolium]